MSSLLEPSYRHALAVRWRDADALGHVNHAVFLTYLEEGRDAFLATVLGSDPMYVIARIELDCTRELRLEHRQVTVQLAVERVGRTSVVLAEELIDASSARVAFARTTIVLWDAQQRAPRPVTPDERAVLGRT